MTTGSHLAEAFQEDAHARLSPSGSKKWFACAGSITLEESIPNVPTTYSDDGTAMHEVAAWCLVEHKPAKKRIGDYIVVSRPGEETRKVQITEDMADLVQGYVEAMYLLSMGNAYWVEQRVNFSEFCGVPNQFGTADFIVFNERDGELGVHDLKTGYTPVEVNENSQLMTYALGTLAKLRDADSDDLSGLEETQDAFTWARAKGIKTVRLGVYQPRISEGTQESVITLEQLQEFAAKLRDKAERVEDAKREHGVIPIASWNRLYLNQTPNDVECAFCRAKPTCPTANATLQEFMMDGFDEIIEGEVSPPAETLNFTLDQADNHNGPDEARALLNKLMKLAPFVEDMITAVRAEVERRLLAGEEMPDFGLDTGRKGARKFSDEEIAEEMLNKQMRIARDHIYTFKLKSPTQLEKLTKPDDATSKPVLGEKQWAKVAKLVTQTDPKPTVKPKASIKNPYTVPKPTTEGFDAVPIDDDDEEQLY